MFKDIFDDIFLRRNRQKQLQTLPQSKKNFTQYAVRRAALHGPVRPRPPRGHPQAYTLEAEAGSPSFCLEGLQSCWIQLRVLNLWCWWIQFKTPDKARNSIVDHFWSLRVPWYSILQSSMQHYISHAARNVYCWSWKEHVTNGRKKKKKKHVISTGETNTCVELYPCFVWSLKKKNAKLSNQRSGCMMVMDANRMKKRRSAHLGENSKNGCGFRRVRCKTSKKQPKTMRKSWFWQKCATQIWMIISHKSKG